ncbi:DUF2509 family protein [Gilliamella apicola]|uniref:DUF2509 family protein n=1 Tax=Gilliamella apicola TaxID=1196095 RepID=A0A2V4E1D7_9GAMM|nr:DUF2509 family protein [Gilliamella apicola]PXZ04666.1 hypothetical protein DKK79_09980 [Gilliamella apicola]
MKIHCNQTGTPNAGFSTLLMVIILTIVGLLLLTGFQATIDSLKKSYLIEIQHYHQFNQASSSLNWATQQTWQVPTEEWQCLSDSQYHLTACIKKSRLKVDNYTLVRVQADDYYLYMLTHFEDNQLIVEKGHWLDYCPEKKMTDCE